MAAFGQQVVFDTIFHPIGYAKALIQIGHEPVNAVPYKNPFPPFKTDLYYPNVLQYCNHIWTMDGFLGMYKGLFPKLIGAPIGMFVQNTVLKKLRKDEEEEKEQENEVELTMWLRTFCIQTSQLTISRCMGIIASQPFHVIMIRQMAQFVGGEKAYDGIFSPISEIWNNEGIKGFFSGLIPRLVGECIQIWMCGLLTHLVNKYFIESQFFQDMIPWRNYSTAKDMEYRSVTSTLTSYVVSNFTYQFTVVSNVMAASGSGLTAVMPPQMPPFTGWRNCWAHLRKAGELKRGNGMFLRKYTPRPAKALYAIN